MLSPYRSLLRIPGTVQFVVPGVIGRFPMSMLGLGAVLLVTAETGSYGIAGAVSATLAVASAIAGPVLGRCADRFGQRSVLLPSLLVFSVAATGLVLVATTGGPEWLLFPPAAVAGGAAPQIGSMVRRRWTALVGGTPQLNTALSLESALDEAVFVIGPVLATLLAGTVWPGAGVLTAVALALVGGLAFARQRATEPPPSAAVDGRSHGAHAITHRGLWVLIATFLAVGTIFGTNDLTIVAFAQEHGHKGLAGVLLAVFAFGSLVAGVWYGTVLWKLSLHRRFLVAIAGLTIGTIPVVLAPSIPVMFGAAILLGVAISPSIVSGLGLVERIIPNAVLTEGFAWVSTAMLTGIALGAGIAGHVVDTAGTTWALSITTLAGLVAVCVSVGGRRALRPAGAPLAPPVEHAPAL